MSCSTTTSECLPARVREQFAGAFRFLVGHAGHGFVEEQQLRLLHQQHADLQPLLLAVRKQAGQAVGVSTEADRLQRFGNAVAGRRIELRQQAAPDPLVRLHRQLEILENRVVLENGRFLELATDAEMRDLGFREARQIKRLAEKSLAFVRPRLAGDDVHHRRLARTVRSDDAAQLTGVDGLATAC
jgi:hypothetical protein